MLGLLTNRVNAQNFYFVKRSCKIGEPFLHIFRVAVANFQWNVCHNELTKIDPAVDYMYWCFLRKTTYLSSMFLLATSIMLAGMYAHKEAAYEKSDSK